MPITEAQKRAQKKYVERHREKINASMLIIVKKHYANNREKILEYKQKYYIMKKAMEQFRNILIDDCNE